MLRPTIKPLVLILSLLALNGSLFAATFEKPTAAQIRFFEEHVRPLLSSKCFKCHGSTKQESGLRLDIRADMLRGGDSGSAVVPGEVDQSLLIEAINYKSLEMPPDEKLNDDQIAVLTKWIQLGAPWPVHDPTVSLDKHQITNEDRAFWSFQPVRDPSIPEVKDRGWSRNPVDKFIYRKLHEKNITPSAEANRLTLIRRAYFDLIGLPPTVRQIDDFLADESPYAYEMLIDQLLASPHYGEKWARHWLDLVHYAESHGHGNDQFRPNAFRYRDYIIQAFNEDKPYDKFICEQLAGDEIAPGDPDVLAATGLLRHWIYENNQRKVRQVREIILNDVTEVTGEVFLGLGIGCARCHDHKFDPILREDYYRLQAFFTPLIPRDDIPLISAQEFAERRKKQQRWEELTEDLRKQILEIEQPLKQYSINRAFGMFPQEIKDIYRKPRSENTPLELQLVALVDRQLTDAQQNVYRKLTGDKKEKWEELKKRIGEFDKVKPEPIPHGMVVSDIGPVAPATIIPGDSTGRDILPGFFSVLDNSVAEIEPVEKAPNSTGRRTALALWISSPKNPLSTRVIVNRIWQYHFGIGIVGTSSDFGRLGELPTHPDLLDWLARRFVEDGWSFKRMHRLIMNSATYRQSAARRTPKVALGEDPTNRWLWRMNIRRLDAEQIHDAMLCVSGELDPQLAGPSVDETVTRRNIYRKVLRNSPNPLMRAFDAPDGFDSTPQRDVTTTATQALMMVNGQWTLKRASTWARQLCDAEKRSKKQIVNLAFRSAFGSEPESKQLDWMIDFLNRQTTRYLITAGSTSQAEERALTDLCHVILNSNQFLYVD